jgi:L-rhamnose mutarotase
LHFDVNLAAFLFHIAPSWVKIRAPCGSGGSGTSRCNTFNIQGSHMSSTNEVKRFGQILKLRSEHRDEYVRQHAAVWPEVLAQIRRSNIRNYSIYLRDGILFAYFEYVGSDFAADMRAMAADPATQRWWALMEPMQEKWPTASAEEWWSNMTEVFHLE